MSASLVHLAAAPAWIEDLVPWLALAIALGLAVALVYLARIAAAAGEVAKLEARLAAIDEIRALVARFTEGGRELDLRRVEHALLEIRDGQRRLEDALLRAAQRDRPGETAAAAPAASASLADRVVDRLLAHGYERVQLVSSLEELDQAFASGGVGEVLVEARRNGVACKGRVLVRGGVVTDVELKPVYTAFP
jgi:hypothetical protein